MKKYNLYNVESLNLEDLRKINGGGVLRRLGKWIGAFWKSGRCGCDEGTYYTADYSDSTGPKW